MKLNNKENLCKMFQSVFEVDKLTAAVVQDRENHEAVGVVIVDRRSIGTPGMARPCLTFSTMT